MTSFTLSRSMNAVTASTVVRQASRLSSRKRRWARAGVDDQPAPGVVDEQEPRVRLRVVLDAELDEDPVRDRHPLDEELDDPVLAELGEDPELGALDLVGCAVRRPSGSAALRSEPGDPRASRARRARRASPSRPAQRVLTTRRAPKLATTSRRVGSGSRRLARTPRGGGAVRSDSRPHAARRGESVGEQASRAISDPAKNCRWSTPSLPSVSEPQKIPSGASASGSSSASSSSPGREVSERAVPDDHVVALPRKRLVDAHPRR